MKNILKSLLTKIVIAAVPFVLINVASAQKPMPNQF